MCVHICIYLYVRISVGMSNVCVRVYLPFLALNLRRTTPIPNANPVDTPHTHTHKHTHHTLV